MTAVRRSSMRASSHHRPSRGVVRGQGDAARRNAGSRPGTPKRGTDAPPTPRGPDPARPHGRRRVAAVRVGRAAQPLPVRRRARLRAPGGASGRRPQLRGAAVHRPHALGARWARPVRAGPAAAPAQARAGAPRRPVGLHRAGGGRHRADPGRLRPRRAARRRGGRPARGRSRHLLPAADHRDQPPADRAARRAGRDRRAHRRGAGAATARWPGVLLGGHRRAAARPRGPGARGPAAGAARDLRSAGGRGLAPAGAWRCAAGDGRRARRPGADDGRVVGLRQRDRRPAGPGLQRRRVQPLRRHLPAGRRHDVRAQARVGRARRTGPPAAARRGALSHPAAAGDRRGGGSAARPRPRVGAARGGTREPSPLRARGSVGLRRDGGAQGAAAVARVLRGELPQPAGVDRGAAPGARAHRRGGAGDRAGGPARALAGAVGAGPRAALRDRHERDPRLRGAAQPALPAAAGGGRRRGAGAGGGAAAPAAARARAGRRGDHGAAPAPAGPGRSRGRGAEELPETAHVA